MSIKADSARRLWLVGTLGIRKEMQQLGNFSNDSNLGNLRILKVKQPRIGHLNRRMVMVLLLF
jgi:hypothetical protein